MYAHTFITINFYSNKCTHEPQRMSVPYVSSTCYLPDSINLYFKTLIGTLYLFPINVKNLSVGIIKEC